MMFQDRILRRLKKTKNFKYLDDLVNSGEKEVQLDCDISLDSSEMDLYREGISIETDDLVIDGNGHIIDAKDESRIFKVEFKNVTFKNILFMNATAKAKDNSMEAMLASLHGGAICAFESKITVRGCEFSRNSAKRGGAIFLGSSLGLIEDCQFFANYCYDFAGAIYNDEMSSLTIKNSKFFNNTAISLKDIEDICSDESSLKIIGCDFSRDNRPKCSIKTGFSGNLVLKDTKFKNASIDCSNMAVIRDCDFEDSSIEFSRWGDLYCLESQESDIPFKGDNIHHINEDMDWVRELSMHELPGEFLNYFPKFNNAEFDEQDRIHDEMVGFLEIWREIWKNESNFLMADVIVNVLTLDPEIIQDEYLNTIRKEGAIDKDSFDELHEIFESVLEFVDFPAKDFKYLDELIHNNENVTLTSDIRIDDDEVNDFRDGIKIDVDNIVIDGQNHVIDGNDRVSIFKIDGKNVTIKNVVFKRGFSNMGGAISNIGEVSFENCKFYENVASELGGAIVNDEKMTIGNCLFENNSTGGVGGAIAATYASHLIITESRFIKNKVSLDIDCPGEILPANAQGFGGAFYNNGKLDLYKVEISENTCERNGGAMIVLPDSKINIEDCQFTDNHAEGDGGVIHTMGEININDSQFTGNSADNNGGVFDGTKSSKLTISNSKFENNKAEKANVIMNKGKLELNETSIDDDDIVDESGKVDDTQNALPGAGDDGTADDDAGDDNSDDVNGTVDDDAGDDNSDDVNGTVDDAGEGETGDDKNFPEGYDDFARKFKDYFEEMLDEKEDGGKGLLLSLVFALWARKFPEDANLVAAAILMANVYDEDTVKILLEDFSEEEYRKRLTEYDPIDDELSSWFMAVALIGMIFGSSDDDESDDEVSSKEYGEKFVDLMNDFESASGYRQNELYDEMKDLVSKWKENYPEDLNMSLAYITLNIPYLTDEKLKEALANLKDQSPDDEDVYETLYNSCKQVLELKNINLDDYLEE